VLSALRTVQSLLQDGDSEAAQQLLTRVLSADPANSLAANYMRQIKSDPIALLGKESHSHVVRPGESLALIARDQMGDANKFYALARYNNIKVPKLLQAGQTIRVPGRAPAPSRDPEPPEINPPPPPPPG